MKDFMQCWRKKYIEISLIVFISIVLSHACLEWNISDNVNKKVSQRQKPKKSEFSMWYTVASNMGLLHRERKNCKLVNIYSKLGPFNSDWIDCTV